MLNALKNNYSLQITLFIAFPFLLWIPSFILPPEVFQPEISGPIYNFFYNFFEPNKFAAVIVAFILIMLQGLFLNYIFTSNMLVPKTTFLPAVLFVTCFSFNPLFHTISPLLFINLFLLFILHNFFKAYNSTSAFNAFFNASVFIGLSILVYPNTWILLALIPLAIITYRSFNWRVWVISFLGLIAPLILIIIYYWFFDKLDSKWIIYQETFSFFPDFLIKTDIASIFLIALTSILTIITVRIALNISTDNIMSIKKKSIILFYAFLTMLYISIYDIFLPLDISFIAFFFAFGFTQVLFKKWKPIQKNILYLLLIITIILGNIF